MEKILRLQDVAALTGYSTVTLRRWIKEGRGPKCRKNGRFYLFSPDDVQEWFESLDSQPAAAPSAKLG